jgi:hypothetical protein
MRIESAFEVAFESANEYVFAVRENQLRTFSSSFDAYAPISLNSVSSYVPPAESQIIDLKVSSKNVVLLTELADHKFELLIIDMPQLTAEGTQP